MTKTAVLGRDRMLHLDGRRFPAAIGRAGVTRHKQEGDAATPAGLLPLRRVLFRADRHVRPPTTRLPREPIAPDDGWCDDPASVEYNRAVTLPHADRHERLWRDDDVYDVVGVLGWNDSPVVRGLGSAIFLHVASADFRPTAGCLALACADLLEVLAAGVECIDVLTD